MCLETCRAPRSGRRCSGGAISEHASRCLHSVLPACDVLGHVQGPEKRAEIGIKDNLIRFSTGIESFEDTWADFEQALKKV